MKIVVLLSGIDSLIAKKKIEIDYPDAEIVSVYYDYGQPFKDNDLASLPDDVEVRKFDLAPDLYPGGVSDVNGRNMAAITLSCQWYQPDMIVCGFLYDEQGSYKDDDIIFCNLMGRILQRIYNKPIKVTSPFFEMRATKSEAIEWALCNGFTIDDLTRTVSCMFVEEVGHQCGTCFKCFTRYMAFLYNGIDVYKQYQNHPFSKAENLNNVFDRVSNSDYIYTEAMRYFLKLSDEYDVAFALSSRSINNYLKK
ncbi:7-cyano-7-deazaguanine synthase [Shewanella sp. KX20019]|uniref:7-cyano-7-deazaguanine synthase n=1 Tax=Shewanella sp. KX20019 TaxID=2803864 RepID=UPI001927407F|nr:7-cyano-7-deazaguanine synthase [Shewanella sp. KX20019]QQX80866.1 7-cyano-7-deazaguanine synthase [Shewanella sp. KX20019]